MALRMVVRGAERRVVFIELSEIRRYTAEHGYYPRELVIGNMFEVMTGGEIQFADIPSLDNVSSKEDAVELLSPITENAVPLAIEKYENIPDDSADEVRQLINSMISFLYERSGGAVRKTDDIIPKEIDTSRLHDGMVVSNFKKLCELVGVKAGEGNTRAKYRDEVFPRYFDFEKIKGTQRILITYIYNVPLEKVDLRKNGNRTIYIRFIEAMLVKFLSEREGFTYTLTNQQWWKLLGMINEKYGNTTQRQLEMLDSSITPWQIKHFYKRTRLKLQDVLIGALNSLEKRRLIDWHRQTVVIDENGKYFVVNDAEERDIQEAERYVMHDVMHFYNINQVYATNNTEQYYRLVMEKLNEDYTWRRYFRRIKIIYNQAAMHSAIEETEYQLRKALNEKVAAFFDGQTVRNYEKWYKKFTEGESTFEPHEIYITAQDILVRELIMLDDQNISFQQLLEHGDEEIDTLFMDTQ